MNCSTCIGSGKILVPDAYGASCSYVRCAGCGGTGRKPLPPGTIAGRSSAEGEPHHATSPEIEALLMRIPHDSDSSWRAWVYLQSFHSAGMSIAMAAIPAEAKQACLSAERDRLAAKLRALLGEGGAPCSPK